MSGQPGQSVLAAGKRNTEEVDQLLLAISQASTETEQALPLLAKGVEAEAQGLAVGPEDLIAREGNVVILTIPARVTLQKDAQTTGR
jgi:hypothetical protein